MKKTEKKLEKKLRLSKETLRSLDAPNLADVRGGLISTGGASCQWACFHTNQTSCTC